MVAKDYFQQRSMESNRTRRYECRNTKKKIRWIGHTLRKEDGEIPKAALLWNPQGNRKRGRPRNSWRRSIIKEAGRSWNELRFLAADRRKWKGLIDYLCSYKGTMYSIIITIKSRRKFAPFCQKQFVVSSWSD